MSSLCKCGDNELGKPVSGIPRSADYCYVNFLFPSNTWECSLKSTYEVVPVNANKCSRSLRLCLVYNFTLKYVIAVKITTGSNSHINMSIHFVQNVTSPVFFIGIFFSSDTRGSNIRESCVVCKINMTSRISGKRDVEDTGIFMVTASIFLFHNTAVDKFKTMIWELIILVTDSNHFMYSTSLSVNVMYFFMSGRDSNTNSINTKKLIIWICYDLGWTDINMISSYVNCSPLVGTEDSPRLRTKFVKCFKKLIDDNAGV